MSIRSKLSRRALLSVGALTLARPLHAAGDAQALLVASDAIRNPGQPFRVTVTLTEFEKGQQVDTSQLVSYSRTMEQSNGQFASLLRFVQPARDTGKLLLKNGGDLWFYDPGTKASVRISPQQRLLGDASNGDVVTVNFARDYKAAVAAEETIADGERKQRKSVKLMLTAASEDSTYAAIELWIDAESRAPLKARFMADSGRLLKTAYYRKFQPQLGADRPTETVIIDGINPQSVTIVRFSDYAARNLPTSWFQRDYLPRFQGD
ncbi:outer membrane lipoprotein-sorting protein [Ideonella sp. DXS22W]|uniref:Outer membrane lipoprotein-sorting protein n=1 Tax=Pseudaquabacterium inlustre TaxID=2984192 RepID=A0ABU9CNE8_9BURK